MLDALVKTLQMRPYVFIFLISFLVISTLNRGGRRALLLLVLGYGIAFLSEFSSIRWGFPYGDYLYIYEAMEGELILGGVPVWDSLSYAFLAYAGYETATFLNWKPRFLIGAFLMTLADVLIDPIAVLGDRWFLGKIFFYPEGGLYFGVPISNFAGWFVVGCLILWSYEQISKAWIHQAEPMRAPQFGPYFYYSILTFMAGVGLFIGAWGPVLSALLIHTPILIALRRRLNKNR